MRIVSTVASALVVIFLVTWLIIRNFVMPVNYVIISDKTGFDIEDVLNIKKEKKDMIYSYDVKAFNEVNGNDKTSISEIDYINENLQQIMKISMLDGEFLTEKDKDKDTCIITAYTARMYFGSEKEAMNKFIRIGSKDYEIVGIYKSVSNTKNVIYIHLSPRREKIPNIESIYLKIDPKYIYKEQIDEFLKAFGKNEKDVKIKKIR